MINEHGFVPGQHCKSLTSPSGATVEYIKRDPVATLKTSTANKLLPVLKWRASADVLKGPGQCIRIAVRLCLPVATWANVRMDGDHSVMEVGITRPWSCVTRRKLQTPGNAEEHKRQETPTRNTYLHLGLVHQGRQGRQGRQHGSRNTQEVPRTNNALLLFLPHGAFTCHSFVMNLFFVWCRWASSAFTVCYKEKAT